MTSWDEQPCAHMWQIERTDGRRSHIHLCDLRYGHHTRPDEERTVQHRCRCGATHNDDLQMTCRQYRDGHTCARSANHTNKLRHKCHCGHEYRTRGDHRTPYLIRPKHVRIP